MGVLMAWVEITADNALGIQAAVDLQKEQSDWYNAKVTPELVQRKLAHSNMRLFWYEDNSVNVQLLLRPVDGNIHLKTCALRLLRPVAVNLVAVELLTKLKERVGDRMVFAVWDNANYPTTMEFYRAVANEANAIAAGFTSCVTTTTPSTKRSTENYYTEWR